MTVVQWLPHDRSVLVSAGTDGQLMAWDVSRMTPSLKVDVGAIVRQQGHLSTDAMRLEAETGVSLPSAGA